MRMSNKNRTKLLVASISFIMVFFNAAIGLSLNVRDGEIIEIDPVGDPEGAPRGPIFNPFSAYLKNNQLVLESVTSYGLVDVELVSTAGDYYTTVFDTGDGSILIPVSGLAGEYTLQLIDASRMHFVGEFEM